MSSSGTPRQSQASNSSEKSTVSAQLHLGPCARCNNRFAPPASCAPPPLSDRTLSSVILCQLGFNLRVSEEALSHINRTSIPLSDGSGYIAGLDTTHHLHCLQSIRHALAPDYYADEIARMAKPEGEIYPTHISHCLEILREILLCKASGALYTYAWSPTQKEPLTNFAVEHTCVDWEILQQWTRDNSFPIHDDLLIHPIYGKWPGDGPV